MDFFSHIAWTYIIFHKLKKKHLYLALLFGALPDIIGWGSLLFYNIFFASFRFGKPNLTSIPDWTWTLYGISHSLVVFGVILLLIWLIFRRIPLFVLAYPIEILMDIPTHSREFLPTPFLWPLSDWHFPGFSWGQQWFILLNWSLIIVLITYINRNKIKELFKRKNKKGNI